MGGGAMYKAISVGCFALLLLTMMGCESRFQPAQSSGRDLWIGIYTDSVDPTKCDMDSPSHNLSYNRRDQLRWYSVDAKQYQVVFEPSPPNPTPGSPFQDNQSQPRFTFNVPTTGVGVKSGKPIPGAVGKYFAYGIKDQNGNVCKDAKSTDPGVNIKP
jgi:hypothetical protein